MRRVLVLGYYGYNTNQLDGQTIKTRDVYRLIKEYVGHSVEHFDTEDFKHNKISVFHMFIKLLTCKTLFYLPAHNNLKYIFPIIFCISKICRFEIHYLVIGGWLSDYIANMPIHIAMLSRIRGIYVETNKLYNDLVEKYKFANVEVFPNFRFISRNETYTQIVAKKNKGLKSMRIAFVSRVEKSKGLDTLIHIAKLLEKEGISSLVNIDFYGPKTDGYYDNYMSEIKIYSYCGVLQPEKVISTLYHYDALIFPTHYEGEGCPGIFIEAMAAALPIVASDWRYNSEFVIDNENGFLCDVYKAEDYVKAIKKLISDTRTREKMSWNSYQKSAVFSAEERRTTIMRILE